MAHAQLSRDDTSLSATPSSPHTSSTLERKEFESVLRDLKEQVIKLAGGNPSNLRQLSVDGVLEILDTLAADKAAKKAADKFGWLKDVTSKTLQCIQTVGGMIADGASEAFPASQMCFNALTFVIQAWQGYEGMFENLAELLEKCTEFLERLTYYREKMDTRLACLASQNLRLFVEVCAKTIQLRKKHARLFAFTRQLFLNDNGIQHLLDMMDRLNGKETLLVNAQTWRIVQDSAGRLDVLLEGQRRQRRDEEMKDWRRTIALRLGFPEESLGSNKEPKPYWRKAYDNRKNSLVDGTGNWVAEHPSFVDWFTSQDPRHYMIVTQGDSGSGKTSLMANILRSFRSADRPGPTSRVVSAYFFPEADRRKEDAEDDGTLLEVVTRTLLWQIATAYEAMTKSFIHILDRTPDFDNSVDQWRKLFNANKERRNEDTTFYLFIDGVDEGIESLVPLLETLSSVADHNRMRILLNARPNTVSTWLKKSPVLDFDTIFIREFNKDDVERYIIDRMDKMPITRDPEQRPGISSWRETILKTLQRQCQGDFVKLNNSLNALYVVDLVDDITAILNRAGQTRGDLIQADIRRLNNARTPKEIQEINEIIIWIEFGRQWFSVDTLEALLSVKHRHRRRNSSTPHSGVSPNGRAVSSSKTWTHSPKLAGLGPANALGISSPVDSDSRSSSPIGGPTQSRLGISLLPFAQKLAEKYSLFTVTDSGNVDWRSIEYLEYIPEANGTSSNNNTNRARSSVVDLFPKPAGGVLEAEINIVRHFLTSVCPPELYERFDFEQFFDDKCGIANKEGIHIDPHNTHIRVIITCLTILTDPELKHKEELRQYACWWLLDHMRETNLYLADKDLKASAGPLLVKLFTEDCGIDAMFWPTDLNVSHETWKGHEGAMLRDVRSEWLYTLHDHGMEELRRWFKDSHVAEAVSGTGKEFVDDVRAAETKELHRVVLGPAARRMAVHLFRRMEFTKRQILAGHWFIRGYLSRCDERAKQMSDSRHDYLVEDTECFQRFELEKFSLEAVAEVEEWCKEMLHSSADKPAQRSLWEIHGALAIFQLTGTAEEQYYQARAREAIRLNPQNWHACHFIASQTNTTNDEAILLLRRAKKEMDPRARNPSWLEDRANSSLLARTTLELGDRLWDVGQDTEAAAKMHRESLQYDYTHFRDYVAIMENYQQREAWGEIILFVEAINNAKNLWEAWYDELVSEFMSSLAKSESNFLARAADETGRWDVVEVFFTISSDVGIRREAYHLIFGVQDAFAKVLEAASGDQNKDKILAIRKDALAMARQHPNDNLPKEAVNTMADSLAQAYLEQALASDTPAEIAAGLGDSLAELTPETDHNYEIWSIIIPVCCLVRYHAKRGTATKLSSYWLHRIVRASLELLSDDDDDNDDIAYWVLARILTSVGDRENTRIIYNLRNHLQAQALQSWEQWKLEQTELFNGNSEPPSQAYSEPTPWAASRESSFRAEDDILFEEEELYPLQRYKTDPGNGIIAPSRENGRAAAAVITRLADRRRHFPSNNISSTSRTSTDGSSVTDATNTAHDTTTSSGETTPAPPEQGILHVSTDSSMPRPPPPPDPAAAAGGGLHSPNNNTVVVLESNDDNNNNNGNIPEETGPTKPDWFVDCAGCGSRWTVLRDEVLHTCADCVGIVKLCAKCHAEHMAGALPRTKTMRCDRAHEMFAIPRWMPSLYGGMPARGYVPLPVPDVSLSSSSTSSSSSSSSSSSDGKGAAPGEARWITMDEWKSRVRRKYLGEDRRSGLFLVSPTSPTMKR